MTHRSDRQKFADLGDVAFSALANDHVLKYNSSTSAWYNGTVSGGGGATVIDELGDVTIGASVGGEIFTWDKPSTEWVNRSPHLVDVRNFGAVAGDSSGAAASANVTAIQDAINTAYVSKAGGVFFAGLFYVNNKIDLQPNLAYVGHNPDTTGLHDLRTSGVTLSASAADLSQISWIGLFNMRLTGASVNANTRTALYLKNASKIYAHGLDIWETKTAIHGINLWDSEFRFCRFDQCGRSSSSTEGAVRFEGSSASSYDCNSTRFLDCTWEQNYATDFQTFGDKAANKLYFVGCKFENAGAITSTTIDLTLSHHTHFTNCHFSHGVFHSGFSTPITILKATTCEDVQVTNCDFELQVVGSSGTRVDQFIWFAGGVEHGIIRDNSFAISTNQTLGVACIKYSGTNNKVTDKGNDFRYIAAGTPVRRTGRPTTYANELRSFQLRTVTASTAASPHDEFIIANADAGPIVIILPAASDAPFELTVKKFDTSANAVTIVTADEALIDGAAVFEITDPMASIKLILVDSSNWVVT